MFQAQWVTLLQFTVKFAGDMNGHVGSSNLGYSGIHGRSLSRRIPPPLSAGKVSRCRRWKIFSAPLSQPKFIGAASPPPPFA